MPRCAQEDACLGADAGLQCWHSADLVSHRQGIQAFPGPNTVAAVAGTWMIEAYNSVRCGLCHCRLVAVNEAGR